MKIARIVMNLSINIFSAVNSSNQTAPRTGFFYNFKQREICVRKWNKQMEGMFKIFQDSVFKKFCH